MLIVRLISYVESFYRRSELRQCRPVRPTLKCKKMAYFQHERVVLLDIAPRVM